MSGPRKLSGAALAAKLGDLSFPEARPVDQPAPASPGGVGPDGGKAASHPSPFPAEARPAAVQAKPRGGRPAKAGVDGMPVNVRLAQADHLALARVAGELIVPGRPMPTVQDVVRGLIRGALRDVEVLKRLVREGA